MSRRLLFADTNVFLHCTFFTDLDWRKCVSADEVYLTLCPAVLCSLNSISGSFDDFGGDPKLYECCRLGIFTVVNELHRTQLCRFRIGVQILTVFDEILFGAADRHTPTSTLRIYGDAVGAVYRRFVALPAAMPFLRCERFSLSRGGLETRGFVLGASFTLKRSFWVALHIASAVAAAAQHMGVDGMLHRVNVPNPLVLAHLADLRRFVEDVHRLNARPPSVRNVLLTPLAKRRHSVSLQL
jgi:hypothetical protein